jgi:uncharacterized membrane protein
MNNSEITQYKYSFSESLAASEEAYYVSTPVRKTVKSRRVESIDLLRGIVMIIMALDHVRDYFHYDAFLYDPTDLSKTNVFLFFTRFITHYCAPVFVFLAGVSAYLYGSKKDKKELSVFLLTRGVWLVLVELFIVSLFRTFNPSYTYVNLQVIWAIGTCMIILSAVVYMPKLLIFVTGTVLIAAHNMLDTMHVAGNNVQAFLWSLLHEAKHFSFAGFYVYVHYPVLPWLGVMILGYCTGTLYTKHYSAAKRKRILLYAGIGAIAAFIILRSGNIYGDAAIWSVQKDTTFSLLSFFNVTKYPPSLLYILVTLGPALIFLTVAEKPLNTITRKIVIIGRVPMFYYLAHILVIHILAVIAALATGYPAMMVLNNSVDASPGLKGYGFDLQTVYFIWIGLILLLYPFCKWFEKYKRTHQSNQWLSYL